MVQIVIALPMRIIFSILYLLSSFICSAQSINIVRSGDPYDTIQLKNDYKLIFSKTESLRVIQLVGPTTDTIIMAESIYSSERAVGWLEADFEDYFVLYFTNDEYNFMLHIFNKQNGKRVLSGTVLGMDTRQRVSYFEDFEKRNMLSLFDFNNGKIERYALPSTPCLHWWYCIKKISLTDKDLTLEYTGSNNASLKKIYNR